MGTLDPAAARERFAGARVARLVTIAPDGRPRPVPIVFALDGDTVWSAVDAKPKRTRSLARLSDVAADPRVALLADHYEEDWARLWWARAEGSARVLDGDSGAESGSEVRRAVAALGERYPQQTVVGAVLAVDVTRWSGWSAADSG